MGREVTLLTDRANLIFIYDPYGRNKGIYWQTESKQMRWEIKISTVKCAIEHLPGKRNVWADMITIWAGNSPRVIKEIKTVHSKSLLYSLNTVGVYTRIDCPT